MKCTFCSAEFSDNAKFCPGCGRANNSVQQSAMPPFDQQDQPTTDEQVFNPYGAQADYSLQIAAVPLPQHSEPSYSGEALNVNPQPAYVPPQQQYMGNAQNYYMQGQYNNPMSPYNAFTSIKEFAKLPQMRKYRNSIISSAVIIYICSFITLIFSVVIMSSVISLIDVAILVGLGLGIQLSYSRACAVACGVYSIFNVLFFILMFGRGGGVLIIIAAIAAINGTFRLRHSWQQYRETGYIG